MCVNSILENIIQSKQAPNTPAESPNLFCNIGVSTKSENTFS